MSMVIGALICSTSAPLRAANSAKSACADTGLPSIQVQRDLASHSAGTSTSAASRCLNDGSQLFSCKKLAVRSSWPEEAGALVRR
ncbi:hypothetical protein D3C76_1306640 [compost metagenome]